MRPALTVLEHEAVPVAATAGPQRLSEQEAEEAARIALQRPGFCQRGYRSLRFSQYGGVVNLAGRALEILPKVERQASAPQCRGAFLRLLTLAGDLPLTALEELGQATREASLLDVFIAAFFDELGLLLRGGLLRRYREESDELPLLRGRLLIARQLRRHALRHDRLACRYDELSADNDWNRVLKAGLAAVRPWLASPRLRRRWSELWPAFDDVTELPDAGAVFARLSPDRQVTRYAAAVRWARWIVASCSPALRAGAAAAPGLLFDANQLFERAVAGHLRTRCVRHAARLELVRQDRGTFLAQITSAPRIQAAVPVRPDLLLREDGALRLVADTKWKCAEPGRNGHIEPAVQDVHQLLAYAAAYRCSDVALIYPWHEGLGAARETVLELPSTHGTAVRLHLVVVDVGAAGLPLRLGAATPWLGALLGSGAA